MRGLFAERSDPRGDVRHSGMSNSRKMLTPLHLKGRGGEMCYQSPVPAEAEELGPLGQSYGPRGAPLPPDPRLSRVGMGEKPLRSCSFYPPVSCCHCPLTGSPEHKKPRNLGDAFLRGLPPGQEHGREGQGMEVEGQAKNI